MTQEDLIRRNTDDIKELYRHADVANREMGTIKADMAVVKTDIQWMRDKLCQVDSRTWWILGTLILGFLINILFLFFH